MLEKVLNEIANIFLAYGLVGALNVLEFYIIVKLYNRNQELHSTLFEFGLKVTESQTKTAGALAEISVAVGKLQDLLTFKRG